MTPSEKHTTNALIGTLLDEVSPLEEKQTEAKMLMAGRIDNAIKEKGWKKKDLLHAMGKNTPSLVTRWLSGSHNFTMDTLVELEEVLGISLLKVDRNRKTNAGNLFAHVCQTAEVQPGLYVDRQVSLNKPYDFHSSTHLNVSKDDANRYS